jgi:Tfp pilus assembly protein PilX
VKRCRGSVLVISLALMLLIAALAGSLLTVSAARCRAIGRESRRAQALALAESAVAAVQARLAAGSPAAPASGALATGQYSAQVMPSASGGVTVVATGRAQPLLGETVAAQLEVTLARRGWQVVAWREVEQ